MITYVLSADYENPTFDKRWHLEVTSQSVNHLKGAHSIWKTCTAKPVEEWILPGGEVFRAGSRNIPVTYLYLDGDNPSGWCPQWRARIEFGIQGQTHKLEGVKVYARDAEEAKRLAGEIYDGLKGEADAEKDLSHIVNMGFWHQGKHGPSIDHRNISVDLWDEIHGNYSTQVQAHVQDLLQVDNPDPAKGRIVLTYGPPGTGKTTMLRALAKAWEPWAEFRVVMDPERMLNDSGYLYEVMSSAAGGKKWHVIILEDCGELISANAADKSGQALSRLLNMADGILGQGVRIMFYITTNEKVKDLHPAVARPGRCVSRFEVDKLTRVEASKWLGKPVDKALTLAELYSIKNNEELRSQDSSHAETGLYL